MARPKVAVFNMEIVGTVNPILPVVAELVQRKCDVRYYLSKETYVKDVTAAGATPVKFDDYFTRWEELMEEESEWLKTGGFEKEALDALPAKDDTMMIRMMVFSLCGGCCLARRLTEVWCQDWRPDLVLYNVMLVHPFLAAKKLGIKTCSFATYPGPGTPMHLYAQDFDEREDFDNQLALHPSLSAANVIAEKVFGVDVLQTQLQCRFFSNEANIVFNIPELQGPVNDYQLKRLEGSQFHWVGTTDPELRGLVPRVEADEDQDGTEAPWRTTPDVKVVLVSLGSLTVEYRWDVPEHKSSTGWITGKEYSLRLWNELLESFAGREDVRVILSIGKRDEARAALGELPSNFFAFTFFDQVSALRHTDVFVTHGGANSIKEAILLGVPMIVTPFCVDQPTNGQAVERQGAGRCFDDLMATPKGELSAVLEDALREGSTVARQWRQRSLELGQALRRGGGAPAAAEACLSLIIDSASKGGA
eukprot:symbB.v1.2.023925.t1/scaffold2227.1/size85294/2